MPPAAVRRRRGPTAAPSAGARRRRGRPAQWKGSETETDDDIGETTVTESDSDEVLGRRRFGRNGGQQKGVRMLETDTGSDGVVTDDNDGESEEDDGMFGHAVIDECHTLKSFLAYAEWSKQVHFGVIKDNDESSGGSWVPRDWLSRALLRGASSGSSFSMSLSVEDLEAEFWRIVEDPYLAVETLYGSDLDSGR